MAEWLERLPEKLGVVSSSPGLYIFLIKVYICLFPCLFICPFISLSFLFVKQCANIYRKYDNTGFVMEQRSCRFIFYFSSYPTYDKGKIRHIARLSSFLFKIECFYRDENDIAPDYQYYIRGKRNTLCLVTFLKTDNSSCYWCTSSFNWKSHLL